MSKLNNDSRRLDIDRAMIGILSVFAVLGVCLVFTIVIATNTLSGLRGFASLQTYWTEARKEASLQLANFIESEDPQYFARFDSAMLYMQKAESVRVELMKDNSDHISVKRQMGDIYTVPQDLDFMITAFENFHTFPDFKEAIHVWDVSDGYIKEMQELAKFSKSKMDSAQFDDTTRQAAIKELFYLDRELTRMQHALAASLSDGAHLINTLILWISISIGLILLITGFLLSFRFAKSMKKWHRAIEVSEQQYRSLFEQNPNAVCLISKRGEFVEGNDVLTEVTGYTKDELMGENFIQFFEAYELERIEPIFLRTLEGEPQTYETVGIKKNGERMYSEITSLPIYIDGKITGVYGIIHDITERELAKQQIEAQLIEKTELLAEVHDRVKNNLALISTLIQLQRISITDKEQKMYWDRTVSRVHSMALVHERVYATESFSSIDMEGCINDIVQNVCDSKLPSDNWKAEAKPEQVYLGIKQAMSVGLLLNEILESYCILAQKTSGGGCISTQFIELENELCLKVLAKSKIEDIRFELEPTALGMKLINVLVKQLKGTYALNNVNGSSIEVRFKRNVKAKK